jgi:hypothetical protein
MGELDRHRGFVVLIDKERIRTYKAKPVGLRLAWLYQGNVLRMHLPAHIRERQDRLRRLGDTCGRESWGDPE